MTGWTPDVISNLNLDTVRILIDSWNALAERENGEAEKKKVSTPEDVKMFQALAKQTK